VIDDFGPPKRPPVGPFVPRTPDGATHFVFASMQIERGRLDASVHKGDLPELGDGDLPVIESGRESDKSARTTLDRVGETVPCPKCRRTARRSGWFTFCKCEYVLEHHSGGHLRRFKSDAADLSNVAEEE
jgi:hypothetical protein